MSSLLFSAVGVMRLRLSSAILLIYTFVSYCYLAFNLFNFQFLNSILNLLFETLDDPQLPLPHCKLPEQMWFKYFATPWVHSL
jgi:hypothetical protein